MENPFNFEQASYTDLLAEAQRLNNVVADLEGTITTANNKLMYVERAFANRDRQYAEAKEIVTELIENNEISDEEAVKQLIKIFDIEILKEVEFTITVEISGVVEIPFGTELDEYSFDVDNITYNGDMVDVHSSDVSISDWNFTE